MLWFPLLMQFQAEQCSVVIASVVFFDLTCMDSATIFLWSRVVSHVCWLWVSHRRGSSITFSFMFLDCIGHVYTMSFRLCFAIVCALFSSQSNRWRSVASHSVSWQVSCCLPRYVSVSAIAKTRSVITSTLFWWQVCPEWLMFFDKVLVVFSGCMSRCCQRLSCCMLHLYSVVGWMANASWDVYRSSYAESTLVPALLFASHRFFNRRQCVGCGLFVVPGCWPERCLSRDTGQGHRCNVCRTCREGRQIKIGKSAGKDLVSALVIMLDSGYVWIPLINVLRFASTRVWTRIKCCIYKSHKSLEWYCCSTEWRT